MNYEIGKYYKFTYLERSLDNRGNPFFWVLDENTGATHVVPALEFQYTWNEIPSHIICTAYKDRNDIIRFRQSKLAILRDRYPITNHEYPFRIVSSEMTDTNGNQFCALIDSFGIHHRFYCTQERLKEIQKMRECQNDKIILTVSGFKEARNGDWWLKLEAPSTQQTKKGKTPNTQLQSSIGEEGQKCEFKSSIVFVASESAADIDEQIKIIMQTIAGMLNTEGGDLYIGVNDDGIIRSGIEDDFEYLNTSNEDPYTYDLSNDHYKLKIINSIGRHLGRYASQFVTMDILKNEQETRYCKITIRKSDWPVWVKGKELFVRTGNKTSQYFGDDITKFVLHKIGAQTTASKPIDITDFEEQESLPQVEPLLSPNAKPNKTTPDSKALNATFGLFEKEALWGYIYFTEGGKYIILDHKKESPKSYVYRAPIPRAPHCHRSYDLVICYNNGDTDLIDLTSAIYGTGRNKDKIQSGKEREKGWNPKLKIVNAFCVNNNQKTKDLIAYISTAGNETFIKFHELTAIAKAPHQHLGNNGNKMLSEGDLNFAIRVQADKNDRNRLNTIGLILRDTSYDCGIPLKEIDSKFKDMLENIISMIDIRRPEEEKLIEIEDSPLDEPATSNGAPSSCSESLYIYKYGEAEPIIYKGDNFKRFEEMAGQRRYSAYITTAKSLINKWKNEEELFFIIGTEGGYVSAANRTRIYHYILSQQIEFLRSGDPASHRTISQLAISEETNIENSCVSRALEQICIIGPSGHYDKERLITARGVAADGTTFNPELLKAKLPELRMEFPKYSDEKLTEYVNRKYGWNIQRRTITKYREELQIPNSRGKI